MRMSGIATLTAEAIERVGGKITVAATRKTTPDSETSRRRP